MNDKIKKIFFILPVLLLALFVTHYVYLATGAEFTECITDTICLSSKDDLVMLVLMYTVTRCILLIGGLSAIILTMLLIRNKYFFLLAGILCFAISVTGLFALFKLTPTNELHNYIHIMVITAFVALPGCVFIYAQFKKRKSG